MRKNIASREYWRVFEYISKLVFGCNRVSRCEEIESNE